jgi:hypothetical protein
LSHVAGGFLSFKPNIPKSLLLDGAHTIESHFALVNHQVFSAYIFGCIFFTFIYLTVHVLENFQLKQIRTALAIASLLKRTLVRGTLFIMLCIHSFCSSFQVLLVLHSEVVQCMENWTCIVLM